MSTKCPATAAAAAICGLTRWVRPPRPWRPSKLRLEVDLEACRVRDDQGLDAPFRVDERARHRLLNGLDDIALLLQYEDAIARYEAAQG